MDINSEYDRTYRLLHNLRDTQVYFVGAIDEEIRILESAQDHSSLDLLKARAFCLAHAGLEDLAIESFNALVSQEAGHKPRNFNKLAQLLIRRGKEDDIDRAVEFSQAALELSENDDNEEIWFAFHNLAGAHLQRGEHTEAARAASQALKQREDRRTRALLDLAHRGGTGGKDLEAVRNELRNKGLLSPDSRLDDRVADRKGLVIILANEMVND